MHAAPEDKARELFLVQRRRGRGESTWNWANQVSAKAARRCTGPRNFLSGYDFDKLAAGASPYFGHIGSDTIQRLNAELVQKRKQAKMLQLKWRVSFGSKRSLGWIPFKAVQLKRQGKCLRFCGKAFRVFEQALLEGVNRKGGNFAQDAVGDWWLCLPVERESKPTLAPRAAVGLDLGLKDIAATSDGEKLVAGHFFRNIEQKIAQAQRRHHKRQAKRLHRTAARRRKDALNKFSTKLVRTYQTIVIGDVSSQKLVKTRMAKSVLDAGWGILKTQLHYKGEYAGRSIFIVNEKNTTRICSRSRALTGPTGLSMLFVRRWICSACGVPHDRDVNTAWNILFAGRCCQCVGGNEFPMSVAEPSQAYRRCEAGISAMTAAA